MASYYIYDQKSMNTTFYPQIEPISPFLQDSLLSTGNSELDARAGCFGSSLGFFLIFIILAIFTLFNSCASPKNIPQVVELNDSVHTSEHVQVIYIPDTAHITLPLQTIEKITPDTSSTLQTDYAESTATITNGLLHHTLRTLRNPIPVPVTHKETTRDSIVYREREVPVPVPVIQEVEKNLTRWQQARLHLANIMLILLGICAAAWLVRKRAWWLRLFR